MNRAQYRSYTEKAKHNKNLSLMQIICFGKIALKISLNILKKAKRQSTNINKTR